MDVVVNVGDQDPVVASDADADAEADAEAVRERGDRADSSLQSLTATLEQIRALSEQAAAQARQTRQRRSLGQSYLEAVAAEEPPVVELVSRMIDALINAGSRFRRAQARALHEEGATMEEIGQIFGVTRQRVSALLKSTESNEG